MASAVFLDDKLPRRLDHNETLGDARTLAWASFGLSAAMKSTHGPALAY